MTSTPTACPACGLVQPEPHTYCTGRPRQPDTSRTEHIEAFKLTTYKGPLDSYINGYDTGHAAATEGLRAEIEQLRVQLAGCGVAAMQNTERSKADRAKPCDYGWSASYSDVCAAVDREIALRWRLSALQAKCEAYEKALKEISRLSTDDDHTLHMSVTAAEALAKHKRGGGK